MSPARHRFAFAAISAAFIALFAAALVVGAALSTPPPAALPVLALTCIGAPMAGAFELARAYFAAREPHDRLRRELALLPETQHPLGY